MKNWILFLLMSLILLSAGTLDNWPNKIKHLPETTQILNTKEYQ